MHSAQSILESRTEVATDHDEHRAASASPMPAFSARQCCEFRCLKPSGIFWAIKSLVGPERSGSTVAGIVDRRECYRRKQAGTGTASISSRILSVGWSYAICSEPME